MPRPHLLRSWLLFILKAVDMRTPILKSLIHIHYISLGGVSLIFWSFWVCEQTRQIIIIYTKTIASCPWSYKMLGALFKWIHLLLLEGQTPLRGQFPQDGSWVYSHHICAIPRLNIEDYESLGLSWYQQLSKGTKSHILLQWAGEQQQRSASILPSVRLSYHIFPLDRKTNLICSKLQLRHACPAVRSNTKHLAKNPIYLQYMSH